MNWPPTECRPPHWKSLLSYSDLATLVELPLVQPDYGWSITICFLGGSTELVDGSTIGPRDVNDRVVTLLGLGVGAVFKMFDGDGGLYYLGRFIGPPDKMFAPLDDYGRGSGCTSIHYWNPHAKKWEEL